MLCALAALGALFVCVNGNVLNISRRVAWFHAPKCGSSFGATVLHYANSSLPRDEGPDLLAAWHPFFKKYPYKKWFQGTFWKPPYDHHRVTQEIYDEFQGDFVGLFRQPEQRVVSSWKDKAGARGSLVKYAEMAAGTVTRELAGQEDGDKRACWPFSEESRAACGGRGARPHEGGRSFVSCQLPETPDIEAALLRLRDGFKFVGLLEQYDLSVCLFHAMFGGPCLPVEFAHMRKSGPTPRAGNLLLQNASGLGGFVDEHDNRLYKKAVERFTADLKQYNIDRARCQKDICPEAAFVFEVQPDVQETLGANSFMPKRWPKSGHAVKPVHFAMQEDAADEFAFDWPGRLVLAAE